MTEKAIDGGAMPPDPRLTVMRLKILYHYLDEEGLYVRANTAGLAIDVIEQFGRLLTEAHVAMRLASAIPAVSAEYDFEPVLANLLPAVTAFNDEPRKP